MNRRYRRKLSKKTYKNLLIKVSISIFILLLVAGSNYIDSKITNEFTDIVTKTMNYDLKLNDKRILNLKKAITSFNVIHESQEYTTPIEGTLYKKYSENKTGIDVLVYEEFVKSIGVGEVISVNEKDKGIEIKILHGDIEAVYFNMEKSNVKKGEKVLKGHIIGSMGDVSKKNKYFHFEIWKDKERVDPLEYIKSNDKTPLSYE